MSIYIYVFTLCRYGARSCIPVPDITAVTLGVEEHARFVLGSDGLWDVVSVEDAQGIALGARSPQKAAGKLAELAWRRRIGRGMRMDDITVLVVDVNGHNFHPVSVMASCAPAGACVIA